METANLYPPDRFYIADLRPSFRSDPYVTFWRRNNAGYAYPLSWAGQYDAETIARGGAYYMKKEGRALIRCAVPCAQIAALAIEPGPGMIDGNAGPVVQNTVANRRKLRRIARNTRTGADNDPI